MNKIKKEYDLVVRGERVAVTFNVYKAYYQELEHEKYLQKKAMNAEWSFEEMQENGISFEYRTRMAWNTPDAQLIEKELMETLRHVISEMDLEDQLLLYLYFFEDVTCGKIGDILGINQSTVSRRKANILEKLKEKMLEEI